jgi:hypothetical protein
METDGDNTYILEKSGRRRLVAACWHRRAPDGSREVGGLLENPSPSTRHQGREQGLGRRGRSLQQQGSFTLREAHPSAPAT